MGMYSSVSDKAIENGAEALGSALGKNSENMARVGLENLGVRLGDRVNNGLVAAGERHGDRVSNGLALLGAFISVGLIGSALITNNNGSAIKDDAAARRTSADPSPKSSEPRSNNAHSHSPRAQKP